MKPNGRVGILSDNPNLCQNSLGQPGGVGRGHSPGFTLKLFDRYPPWSLPITREYLTGALTLKSVKM